MKVEGPQRTSQSGPAKKKDRAGEADGSFGSLVTGAAGGPAGTAATQSIASVDVLLAAQGADDPAQRGARQRMRQRADSLLRELDGLKAALLTGRLTVGHVIDIADVIASHREKVMDPRLTAILDEIDLRAQIELAKLRMALDKQLGG